MKRLALLLMSFWLLGGASLDFDANDFIGLTSNLPATAAPLTGACWYNADELTTQKIVFSLADSAVPDNYFLLQLAGHKTNDPLRYTIQATTAQSLDVNNHLSGVWVHGMIIDASSTSHTAYKDGTASTTGTTSITPTSIDRFRIGRTADSTPAQDMDGKIAHCGFWTVALNASERQELVAGQWPMWVKTESITGAWPIFGENDPVPDLSGNARTLAFDASPTVSTLGPPIHWPGGSP